MLFAFRELADRHRDDLARLITAEHGKVLEDARGEVARGHRGGGVRLRDPPTPQGEFSEDVSSGVDASSMRQPLGRGGRHHPVQLPGHGPDVDVPGGHRLRELLHPQAVGTRSVALAADRRPVADAGLPEEVFRWSTATPWPSTRCSTTLTWPRCRSWARPRWPGTCSNGPPPPASGCQALGGAKNHAVVMADADVDTAADALIAAGYGSAGERCMAISAVVAVGDGDPWCGP